jgi:hypothetical protein
LSIGEISPCIHHRVNERYRFDHNNDETGPVLNGSLSHMPLQTPVNARFVLERDEFSEASRLAMRNLSPRIKWPGYAQIGLLFALMLTAIAYKPEGKTQPVSFIILILVWLVFCTGLIAQRAWREHRFAPMEGKEIWYEFREEGFRCGLPNAESQTNWPAISGFIETDALFVLLGSGLLFYTIPKRALAANADASLRQLLQDKVASRR